MQPLVFVMAATACSETPPQTQFVHGLRDVTVATNQRAPVMDDVPSGCGIEAVTQHELVADVAPAAGKETIRASLVDGIAVYDTEQHLIARSPGYDCEGSADEVVLLEAGSAFGEATIALGIRQGGHQHDEVALSLFRMDPRAGLHAVFTSTVEERDGADVKQGAVWVLPNGLLYRRPGAHLATVWTFDPVGRLYTFTGRLDGSRSSDADLH